MIQAVGLKSNIGQRRRIADLTQLELSQIVGVTETTIANWEKGRSGLAWIERVAKMCQALDCSPSDLIIYEKDIDQVSLSDGSCQLSALRKLAGTEKKPLPTKNKTG